MILQGLPLAARITRRLRVSPQNWVPSGKIAIQYRDRFGEIEVWGFIRFTFSTVRANIFYRERASNQGRKSHFW